MTAQAYPLDFDALNRGDLIPAERIEGIFNITRYQEAFRFKSMHLAAQIEAHFLAVRADVLLVKHEGDDLRLLTHQQQAAEAQRRASAHISGFGRAIVKAAGVDVAQLTDEERERHDRFLHVSTFRLQQLRKRPPPQIAP